MTEKPPFSPAIPTALVADIPTPEHSYSRSALRVSLAIAGFFVLAGVISITMWLKNLGAFNLDHQKIEMLANYNYYDNSIVYDRDGAKIGEFFDKYHIFVPIAKMPQHLIDALIAIEDRSFYEHHGVDYRGISRAIFVRMKTGRTTQGGSTLSQQLVRNTILSQERSLERKALEIFWALEVERYIPKEKILEIYLNSMFLGNGAYGVGAAAQRYFGKRIEDTTPAETALIAGLFQSPSRYNPAKYPERAKKRQTQVIEAMRKSKKITADVARKLKAEPLTYHPYKPVNGNIAPWFVDHIHDSITRLKAQDHKLTSLSGLRIHTTLDSRAQTLAERSIKSYNFRFDELRSVTGTILDPKTGSQQHDTIEAAMLVTDPRNGDILAMVGGRDYETSKFNRASSAKRSPGSAFKPVVYTQALMSGFKWSDLIYVSPVNIENYRPRNLEEDYLTETTMLRAFFRSMNAPTVELAEKVGLPAIMSLAKRLGVESPVKNEFGSALGSSTVTMMDMARMYGTFAAGGVLTDVSAITKITDGDGTVLWERPTLVTRQARVLNSQAAYLMTQGMRSVLTEGTAKKSSDLAEVAAGKTGTSNNSSDNWFCGYTPETVSIVWVGTEEQAPIRANVSGGNLALPVWDLFMRGILPIRPAKPFYRPEGIVDMSVHPVYGHRVEGGITMSFLTGNIPKETESALEKMSSSESGGYRNVFRH